MHRSLLAATAACALGSSATALGLVPQSGPGASAAEATVTATAARGSAATPLALLSQLSPTQLGSSAANDCWGYTSGSGREYAIVGLQNRTAWVEITDPTSPVIVASHNGPSSLWHDPKTFQDHCYVVSEGGSGIQVFDMSAIDAGTVSYLGDVTTGGTTSTHNVAIDEDSGFLYRCGGSSEGLRFYDLNQSKSNPPYVGEWSAQYVHDAQIVTYTSGPAAGRQIAYCCTGNSGFLYAVDVTDKANPTTLSSATWPQDSYSHQGWLDEDQKYFYLNDEGDESNFGLATTTIVIDVSDPFNVTYVTSFDNGDPATGHNGYIVGDLLYEANYTSGIRVFDLSVDPLNPPEVQFYDTHPSSSSSTTGLWSCYPFFASGVVIGTDTSSGLFVWFGGPELLDLQLVGAPPPFLTPMGQVLPVTITEAFPGALQAGTEMLHTDAGAGWHAVPLIDQGGGSYEAQFPNNLPCASEVQYYFSAQSTNGLTWTEPAGGQNDPYSSLVAATSTTVFEDDFETNKGWTPQNIGATAGDFERGVPVDDPGWPYDPFADADGSGQCWVTENALGNTDVDNGGVRLLSPPLDLTGSNPIVQYDYYLYLTDESGIDELRVKANDNAGSGWVDVALHTTSGETSWRRHYIEASDFVAAGVSLTANVQLRFIARDDDPQSTVEAGVDGFKVLSLACGPATGYCIAGTSASGCTTTLSSSGTPSLSLASGFTISGANGEGARNGMFFFGQNGRQANPWGNGSSLRCVIPPTARTPVQSGGGTQGGCDASWSVDFNAYSAANPGKAPSAGTPAQLQLWYRDPFNTSNQTTSFSNALEFTMAP